VDIICPSSALVAELIMYDTKYLISYWFIEKLLDVMQFKVKFKSENLYVCIFLIIIFSITVCTVFMKI
jgi:hypothetical protein